jgi:hypothetical protein
VKQRFRLRRVWLHQHLTLLAQYFCQEQHREQVVFAALLWAVLFLWAVQQRRYGEGDMSALQQTRSSLCLQSAASNRQNRSPDQGTDAEDPVPGVRVYRFKPRKVKY